MIKLYGTLRRMAIICTAPLVGVRLIVLTTGVPWASNFTVFRIRRHSSDIHAAASGIQKYVFQAKTSAKDGLHYIDLPQSTDAELVQAAIVLRVSSVTYRHCSTSSPCSRTAD
jgi:hypothetical protein